MAPQAIPGHSGRVQAAAGGGARWRGMEAGEGRVRGFGEAFAGLLGTALGGGAGNRTEVLVLTLLVIPGLGDL